MVARISQVPVLILKSRSLSLADSICVLLHHRYKKEMEDISMAINLKGRNFLTLKDFTPEEIQYMLDLSADLKAKRKNGVSIKNYTDKNIALIFEKTSTRTRCSFEVAANDMGMGVTYLDPSGSQIGKRRSIPILQGFSEECLTVSSTVDMDRIL